MPTELLTYLGKFRLPGGTGRQFTFGQSVGPLAFRPSTGNLLIRGHNLYPEFLPIHIPSDLSGNAVASPAGDWIDPTFGNRDPSWPATSAGTSVAGVGGCFIDGNDNFYGTIAIWYNTSGLSIPSFFRSNLASQSFRGYWRTTNPTLKTSGYIAELPKKLRETWGHEIGFALSAGSGTSGTTAGPGMYTANYSELPNGSTMIETPRLTWNQAADPYLYGANRKPWSKGSSSSAINAVDGVSQCNAMVGLVDHVVWCGRNAADDAATWYGSNGVVENGVTYNDPCTASKGYHATRYVPKLFVSHVDDLIGGTKAITEIDLSPYCKTPCGVLSMAVDSVGGRLFILEARADTQSYQSGMPLVHVFKFKTETEMQAELDALQAALTALQAAAAAVTAERDVLRSEVVSLTDTVTTVTTQRDQLQAKINAAVAALA